MLVSALCGALMCGLALRARGIWAGLFVGTYWVFSPMVYVFGTMANYETFILCFGTMSLLCLNSNQKSHKILGWFLLFLCVMSDWIGAFVAIGALFIARERSAFTAYLRGSILSVGLAIALTAILIFWWLEIEVIMDFFKFATSDSTALQKEIPYDYFSRQVEIWTDFFGWAGIILFLPSGLFFLHRIWRRRFCILTTQVSCWFILQTTNVVAFPARIPNHEFWWFYSIPVIAFGGGWLCQWLARRNHWLALTLIVASVWTAPAMIEKWESEDLSPRSRAVADFFSAQGLDEDSIVFTYQHDCSWQQYSPAWNWVVRQSEDEVVSKIEEFYAGALPFKKLAMWFTDSSTYSSPTIRALALKHRTQVAEFDDWYLVVFLR